MNRLEKNFNVLWESVVSELIDQYMAYCSEYGYTLLYHRERCKNRLKRKYIKNERVFLDSYMEYKCNETDRHKKASCMVGAILWVRPLRISLKSRLSYFIRKKPIDSNIILANQFLALSVAKAILEGYIAADKRKGFPHKILMPVPFNNDGNSYEKNTCLEMYYTGAKNFNLLTYSNIFFLIEKYSCRRIISENLEDELRSIYTIEKKTDKEIEEKLDAIKFHLPEE